MGYFVASRDSGRKRLLKSRIMSAIFGVLIFAAAIVVVCRADARVVVAEAWNALVLIAKGENETAFATLAVGFLGFTGVCLTMLFTAFHREEMQENTHIENEMAVRKLRDNEVRSLCSAINAEIATISQYFRSMADNVGSIFDVLDSRKVVDVPEVFFPLFEQLVVFPSRVVFNNNVQNIGLLLPHQMAHAIVHLYYEIDRVEFVTPSHPNNLTDLENLRNTLITVDRFISSVGPVLADISEGKVLTDDDYRKRIMSSVTRIDTARFARELDRYLAMAPEQRNGQRSDSATHKPDTR